MKILNIYASQWKSMTMNINSWKSMKIHNKSMTIYENLRKSMKNPWQTDEKNNEKTEHGKVSVLPFPLLLHLCLLCCVSFILMLLELLEQNWTWHISTMSTTYMQHTKQKRISQEYNPTKSIHTIFFDIKFAISVKFSLKQHFSMMSIIFNILHTPLRVGGMSRQALQ